MKGLYFHIFGIFRLFFLLGLAFYFPGTFIFAQEIIPSWVQSTDIFEVRGGRGLSIKSNPADARVFIDGIERGLTPLLFENISPGEYSIRLEKDGYKERRFSISINSGTFVDLTLELEEAKGQVLVQVQAVAGLSAAPSDPLISVDGVEMESMSFFLPVGWRTIRARSFGWEDETFDIYVEEDSVQNLVFELNPAALRLSSANLSRRRFNPSNAGSLGSTELFFMVSSPGEANLVIQNSSGIIVYQRALDNFESWFQSVQWNGRNKLGELLPDGVYLLILEVKSIPVDNSEALTETLYFEVLLDSASIIQPLNIASGKSGLLFTPFPDILAPQAMQIESVVLFGYPPETDRSWRSLPFSGAFRFSPFDKLELAAAINVLPVLNQNVRLGFALSSKWEIFNQNESGLQLGNLPLGLALGASLSWADSVSLTPFGMGSGIELFLPLSLEYGSFSFHLTPAFLLTSGKSFLGNPEPHILTSVGVMMKSMLWSAGFSLRTDFDLSSGSSFNTSFMSGLEFKYTPLPSNLVFTLMTGIWFKGSSVGGFGGIGIGMIY